MRHSEKEGRLDGEIDAHFQLAIKEVVFHLGVIRHFPRAWTIVALRKCVPSHGHEKIRRDLRISSLHWAKILRTKDYLRI